MVGIFGIKLILYQLAKKKKKEKERYIWIVIYVLIKILFFLYLFIKTVKAKDLEKKKHSSTLFPYVQLFCAKHGQIPNKENRKTTE